MTHYRIKDIVGAIILVASSTITTFIEAPIASATTATTVIGGDQNSNVFCDGTPRDATTINFGFVGQASIDASGNIFVINDHYGNNLVCKITPDDMITRYAGGGSSYTYDGDCAWGDCSLATGALLATPTGLMLTPDGSSFISDSGLNRVRRVDPSSTITTYSGLNHQYHSYNNRNDIGDGEDPNNARMQAPEILAFDQSTGTLFLTDGGLGRVRMVTGDSAASGSSRIITVAGNGSSPNQSDPSAGDGGLATSAPLDPGYVVYHNDSLYISSNNTVKRVNLATGLISTFASITGARALAFDRLGNLWVGDSGNVTANLYKVTPDGSVTSVLVTQVITSMIFDGSDNLIISGPGVLFKISGLIPAPTLSYVALGDSISSGEGINYGFWWNGSSWINGNANPTWKNTGTGGPFRQQCHRSDDAYTELLANKLNYSLTFSGCSGASAAHGMLGEQEASASNYIDAQLGDLSNPSSSYDIANPDLVTLTLGADDVNFGAWVTNCYDPFYGVCGTSSDSMSLSSELFAQKLSLRKVLSEIDRRAANAGKIVRVVVTDYANPFQSTYASCLDTSASILDGTFPGIGISESEQNWLVANLNVLNANIADEVSYASTNDTHISITLADISQILVGHQFCDAFPWTYGASIAYPVIGQSTNPAPFHPLPQAQSAIADFIASLL